MCSCSWDQRIASTLCEHLDRFKTNLRDIRERMVGKEKRIEHRKTKIDNEGYP